jgi:putrescine transport system substrate-binding protein
MHLKKLTLAVGVAALVLAACGKKEEPATPPAPESAAPAATAPAATTPPADTAAPATTAPATTEEKK